MDIGQFFQRDHERVSGLIEKLLDTSDGAVKTRERLFGQLKAELEAHRSAVEEVLHPVLKKHPETRELVPTKREANELDRALAELDGMPKNEEGFAKKLGELKRNVERHLREEERRVVPAFRKALRDEDADDIARRLAAEKRQELQGGDDEKEEPQQGRQESRRDEAGRNGSNGGNGKGAASAAADLARQPVEAAAEGARGMAAAGQRTAEKVGETVGEELRRGAQSNVQAMRSAGDMARESAEGVSSAAGAARAGAAGLQEMQRTLMQAMDRTLRRQARVGQELMGCTTAAELAETQRRWLEESIGDWFETGRSVLQAASRVTADMAGSLQQRNGRR